MNAIDELRALLDERNIEYKDHHMYSKHVFHWGEPFHGAMFTAALSGEWTELVVENPTPQQAIDATLGRVIDKGEPQGMDGNLDQSQIDWLRLMPDGWDPLQDVAVVSSDDYLVPTDRILFETDETGFASKVCLDGTWYYPENSDLRDENAKLRRLVCKFYHCQKHTECVDCPYVDEPSCFFSDELHELGIEVD